MSVISKTTVRAIDLEPGMYVKRGSRSYWKVIHNHGWIPFSAPYRNEAMAVVVMFSKAYNVHFIWAYARRGEEVEVVEFDVEPRVAPYVEEEDDRSPWV